MRHQVRDYTFNPTAKTIAIGDEYTKHHTQTIIEDFLIITNITTGDTLYQFNDIVLGGSYAELSNTLTLTYETSGMSSTDKLQIFLDIDPKMNIVNKGGFVVGDITAPLATTNEELHNTFVGMYKELKKIRWHLSVITGEDINNTDIDGE